MDIIRPEDFGGKRSDQYQGYRGAEVGEYNRYSKRLIIAHSFPDIQSAKAYVKASKAVGIGTPDHEVLFRVKSHERLTAL